MKIYSKIILRHYKAYNDLLWLQTYIKALPKKMSEKKGNITSPNCIKFIAAIKTLQTSKPFGMEPSKPHLPGSDTIGLT